MDSNIWKSWNGKINHKYDVIYAPKEEDAIVKIVNKKS